MCVCVCVFGGGGGGVECSIWMRGHWGMEGNCINKEGAAAAAAATGLNDALLLQVLLSAASVTYPAETAAAWGVGC